MKKLGTFNVNLMVCKRRLWPWSKWETQFVAFADEESADNLTKLLQVIVKEQGGELKIKKNNA